MIKNVYDNGENILGNVENVKKYIKQHQENDKELCEEILEELNEIKDEKSIVFINYDLPMGYIIYYWTEEDIYNKELV